MNTYTDIEVERRAPRYRRWQLFLSPPFRFFKTYVLKGGWREGMPGFIHAVHDAIYRFAIMAKIEEKAAWQHRYFLLTLQYERKR